MAYPPDIKIRTHELYLESGHIPTVYKKLTEEYRNRPLPKEITIRKWIDESKLPEIQKNLHTDVLVRTRTQEIERQVRRQEEHKENYARLIEKANETLFGEDKKEFHSAMEATNALNVGIQGERKISQEQLNLEFVEAIFASITNIIYNEEQLNDIGIEFRKILAKHRTD